jgi:TRAP-type C4-dicarboxylate transport system substrate-binding protein
VSPQAWGALSEADRRIFIAAAKAGGQVSRQVAGKAEADGVEMLKKAGMQVVTSVDRAAFEKAVQSASAEAAKQFGGAVDRIRAVK